MKLNFLEINNLYEVLELITETNEIAISLENGYKILKDKEILEPSYKEILELKENIINEASEKKISEAERANFIKEKLQQITDNEINIKNFSDLLLINVNVLDGYLFNFNQIKALMPILEYNGQN